MKNRKVWKFLGFLIGLFILIQAVLGPSNSGHLDVLYHANLLKIENDLANMINALENFKEDVHRYPSTKEGLDALMSQPRSSIEWRGPYITQPELTWKREIPDPWGSKYIYLYPAQYGDGAYDLYSCGKNKKDDRGQQDDISNWKGSDENFYERTRLSMDPLLLFKACLLLMLILIILILFRTK